MTWCLPLCSWKNLYRCTSLEPCWKHFEVITGKTHQKQSRHLEVINGGFFPINTLKSVPHWGFHHFPHSVCAKLLTENQKLELYTLLIIDKSERLPSGVQITLYMGLQIANFTSQKKSFLIKSKTWLKHRVDARISVKKWIWSLQDKLVSRAVGKQTLCWTD